MATLIFWIVWVVFWLLVLYAVLFIFYLLLKLKEPITPLESMPNFKPVPIL